MKRLYLFGVFSLSLVGIIFLQFYSDQEKKRLDKFEPIVLESKIVKAADLGLDNAAADLAWLSAIQYFGGADSVTYEKLDDFLELATSLDPKFTYPYAYGVLILPSLGMADGAISLGEKGLQYGEPDWRLPYYLATTYHMSKDDHAKAAKYFDIAANTPGAPTNIQKAAASYGSYKSDRDQTESIWQGIYESTDDEVVKARAEKYLVHFEIMNLLEKSAQQYNDLKKNYPKSPDDLVGAHILKAFPPDPFGYTFKFDETGHVMVQ